MESEYVLIPNVHIPLALRSSVNPIGITPVRTLSNRLPRFPSEFFVNLEEPADTISSYFGQGVPKDCLHIIVGGPTGECS